MNRCMNKWIQIWINAWINEYIYIIIYYNCKFTVYMAMVAYSKWALETKKHDTLGLALNGGGNWHPSYKHVMDFPRGTIKSDLYIYIYILHIGNI